MKERTKQDRKGPVREVGLKITLIRPLESRSDLRNNGGALNGDLEDRAVRELHLPGGGSRVNLDGRCEATQHIERENVATVGAAGDHPSIAGGGSTGGDGSGKRNSVAGVVVRIGRKGGRNRLRAHDRSHTVANAGHQEGRNTGGQNGVKLGKTVLGDPLGAKLGAERGRVNVFDEPIGVAVENVALRVTTSNGDDVEKTNVVTVAGLFEKNAQCGNSSSAVHNRTTLQAGLLLL